MCVITHTCECNRTRTLVSVTTQDSVSAKVSTTRQGVKASRCQGAKVPRCQGAKVPRCQGARCTEGGDMGLYCSYTANLALRLAIASPTPCHSQPYALCLYAKGYIMNAEPIYRKLYQYRKFPIILSVLNFLSFLSF